MLESFKARLAGSPKDRRREPREAVEDGTVVIKGQTFRLHDWSSRAFMASPCTIDCKTTDRIDIKFSARFPDGPIEFDCRAIVVRIDRDKEELAAYFAMLDDDTQAAIERHFSTLAEREAAAAESPQTSRPAPAPPPAAPPAADQAPPEPEAAPPAETTPDAEEAPEAAETAAAQTPAEPERPPVAEADAPVAEPAAASRKSAGFGVEEIKRRTAALVAEMAESKQDEHRISAIFELGVSNLTAFREKVDAAGITKILQETPRIKLLDHDCTYGIRFRKLEFVVFIDWENGGLCRDVSIESDGRRPRIIGIDQDAALDELIDCLARMLGQIEADAAR